MTRMEWARRYIAAAPDAPAYGTPEWLALPDGPEKVAAVVRAAECWATEGDDLEHRLAAELEALRRHDKAAEDAAFHEAATSHRKHWTGRGFRPDPSIEAEVAAEWREWIGGAA